MGRRFRGESVHKVDGKGRVSIPAAFRRVLEEGDPDWVSGSNPNFVIVYGLEAENCLVGYTIEGIDAIDDKVSNMPYGSARKLLERRLSTQATYAQVDENGRIVLPAKLRQKFAIASEAIFAGMNDKFQIWNPEAYDADMAELGDDIETANPLELLNQLRDGG